MKVEIIGYTNHPEKGYLPEAISAGFARVSRKKEPISSLVEEAKGDIEKSRQSNRTIIYEYGHNSIAEHVVFNLVMENVSRYLSAIIMKHRLNSYIEKSQRYIEIDSGYVIPNEITNPKYKEICDEMFKAYHSLYTKLAEHLKKKYPDQKEAQLKSLAKEDARFVLPISTYTQFGMTINSRNYEYLIMRLNSEELDEAKEIAHMLTEQGKKVAPSLIKYIEPNEYFKTAYKDLAAINIIIKNNNSNSIGQSIISTNNNDTSTNRNNTNSINHSINFTNSNQKKHVNLIEYDNDDKLINALLHSTSNTPYEEIKKIICNMGKEEKEEIIKTSLSKLKTHDPVIREYEYLSFTFEIEMSECCFHQFLRHRMITLTEQQYCADEYIIPPNIKEAGLTDEYKEAIKPSLDFFVELKKGNNPAAPYILPNAIKKRVLVKMNARELYNFSRIREEEYSQWEIRKIAKEMSSLAKKAAPLAMQFTGGRNEFKSIKS